MMAVVVLQLIESEKASIIKYQQMTSNLKYYIREKHIPPMLEKKLLSYYQYRFQDRCFKENDIIGSLAGWLMKNSFNPYI